MRPNVWFGRGETNMNGGKEIKYEYFSDYVQVYVVIHSTSTQYKYVCEFVNTGHI